MIHVLYSALGWHDQDVLSAFLVWNAVLTVTAIAAYLRNGSK